MSHCELDLTVGELPPILDDGHEAGLRKLIDDFAGLQTSRINRQRKYLRPVNARYSIGQITGEISFRCPS